MKHSLGYLHRSLNVDEKAQPLTKRELSGHCEGGEGKTRIRDKLDEPMYITW